MADTLHPLPERVTVIEQKLDVLTDTVDRRFEQIDRRFEQIDRRFEQIDLRFEQIDQRFEQIDQRFEQIDRRFEASDARMDGLSAAMEKGFHEVSQAFAEHRQYAEYLFAQSLSEIRLVQSNLARLERKFDQFVDTQTRTSPRRPPSGHGKKR